MSSKAHRHDAEYEQILNQERFILEVTERICGYMEEHNISRAELARRLGKTKGYVSQLLSGGRNLTVRTIADVSYALGANLHLEIAKDRRARSSSQSNVIWRTDPDLWKSGVQTCGLDSVNPILDSIVDDDLAASQAV